MRLGVRYCEGEVVNFRFDEIAINHGFDTRKRLVGVDVCKLLFCFSYELKLMLDSKYFI